jgi:hypothetical protein
MTTLNIKQSIIICLYVILGVQLYLTFIVEKIELFNENKGFSIYFIGYVLV